MAAPELSLPPDRPVLTLIQQLKDGTVLPSVLTKEQRQGCVAVLRLEGYTYAHMAQILNVSEKTIQRDITEIRARNAADPPNLEQARQLIGEFLVKMETHHTHLMRLARDKNASVAERAQAEFFAARVLNDLLLRLQSLGYLPERPQQVVGDFVHRVGGVEEPSLDALGQMLEECQAVAQEVGLSPEMAQHLNTIRQRLERARISQQLEDLRSQQAQAKTTTEESDVT